MPISSRTCKSGQLSGAVGWVVRWVQAGWSHRGTRTARALQAVLRHCCCMLAAPLCAFETSICGLASAAGLCKQACSRRHLVPMQGVPASTPAPSSPAPARCPSTSQPQPITHLSHKLVCLLLLSSLLKHAVHCSTHSAAGGAQGRYIYRMPATIQMPRDAAGLSTSSGCHAQAWRPASTCHQAVQLLPVSLR